MAMTAEHRSAAVQEHLSVAMDGEADDAAMEQACRCWREDVEARDTWHTYHLIGDALRSDDLCRLPRRDSAFIAGFRERLEAEPVLLAPGKPVRDRARIVRWRNWSASAAVVAGVVVGAGVVFSMRPASESSLAALQPPLGMNAANGQFQAGNASPTVLVDANVNVLRDPHLERYLAAHRQFSGMTALGVPNFQRASITDTSNR